MLRLFRFLKPFRMAVLLVLVLTFFQVLSELYLPTLMADIVDLGIVQADIPYILKIGGLMLLVTAGGALCSVIAGFLSSKVASGFGKDLRSRIFTHVESFSLREFDQIGTASLITRTTNDITQIQQVLMMMLRMAVMAPMMCIGGVIMALSRDARLSWVIVAIIPILAGAIFTIARKGLPLFKAMQTKLDKLNRVTRENLTGIRVIRSFNRVGHEKNALISPTGISWIQESG